jgi:hypothetical protein
MAQRTEETKLLVSAAKVLGKAAGKIAAIAGGTADADVQTSPKRRAKGKLAKRNKVRLPRKQKKAQRKNQSRQEAT